MNLPNGEKLIVAKPDVEEQSRIAANIDTHLDRISAEEQLLEKIKLQKRGLMHDLLSGKVRVKTDTSKEKTPS
ncbi:MAG: type restriction enzyme subunit [Thermodesulfobacteriota bacterium]|nr:type restriction enzyme subunit [Thermodesulfobacteriota bacterium]